MDYGQVATLLLQAALISTLLLILFRMRTRFGLSLLFITLGAFQLMQATLARSFYVELAPGVMVSPGSLVLFTSSLFALLLIYIREDASEARKLIYGLVIANFALEASFMLVSLQMDNAALHNIYGLPRELFRRDPRVSWFGTAALFLDGAFVIMAYEWVSRHIPRSLFLRIYLSMTMVLIFDALAFATGSFWGDPLYARLLWSGLAGKVVISIFYAAILTGYLRFFEKPEHLLAHTDAGLQDLFGFLTYRQKYEVLRLRMVRDALTGLYNRMFFDDMLPREVERSFQMRRPLALIIIDVDHFKEYNDTYGHPEGDNVLRYVSSVLVRRLRASDLACRYGGDEFALILPDCDARFALMSAERIRSNLIEGWGGSQPLLPGPGMTVTMGIAFIPQEAASASELVRLADRRLYFGKRAGRDCIIPEQQTTTDAVPRAENAGYMQSGQSRQS